MRLYFYHCNLFYFTVDVPFLKNKYDTKQTSYLWQPNYHPQIALFFYKFKKSIHEWKARFLIITLDYSKKKKSGEAGRGGCGHRISRGIEGRACTSSRGRSKKFLILVFDLGISKGFCIILHNFQSWSFVFPGIFRVNIPYHKPIVCSYF